MKLGEFVKKYRQEHGLSQRTFAKICNVSNGYISMIEKGENPKTHEPITPTFPMLRAICSGMGITVHELLSIVDDLELDFSSTEKPATKSGHDELYNLLSLLSDEDLDDVLEFVRYKLSKK